MSFLSVKQSSASCKILYPVVFVLSICSTTEAQENGTIPALIAFGDSILDTGNNNNLLTFSKCNFPPYGISFAGRKPTGRFCDGKILTDLIAESLGIKETVPAYLDPNLQSNDLPTGVCFASGGSGLDPTTSSLQNVLWISQQLNNFKAYLRKLEGVVGGEKAKNIISNSLVILSAGNNDIAITFSGTGSRFSYNFALYSSQLVSWASSFLKDLHELGVRKVAVFSTLPLGCLPGARSVVGGGFRLCGEGVNALARLFNSKLAAEVNNLKSSLPQAKLVFVDVYTPLLDIIRNPTASGFLVPDRGCCAAGLVCTPYSTTCSDPSRYIFWDFAHPSEKAYRLLASPILQTLKTNFS